MRTNEPPTRLRDFLPGQRVILDGVPLDQNGNAKKYTVIRIREDGYFDLNNPAGHLAVTASPGHLAELA